MANIKDFITDIGNLQNEIALGYVKKEYAQNVNMFARATLPNNTFINIAPFLNLNPFVITSVELFISSTSASDTFIVQIDYIDQNRDLKQKNVTLNGITPVSCGTDIYCAYHMINGNGVSQVGTIDLVDGATIYQRMPLTDGGVPANHSLSSHFSIPRGYIGLITNASVNVDKGADVRAGYYTRARNKVFILNKVLSAYQSQSLYQNNAIVVDEETDIKVDGYAQTGGVVFVDYTIVLIKKNLVGIDFK